MLNIFKRNNKNIIVVVARELDTNAIKTFRLDSIAYNNWMIANDTCQDYEVLEIRR